LPAFQIGFAILVCDWLLQTRQALQLFAGFETTACPGGMFTSRRSGLTTDTGLTAAFIGKTRNGRSSISLLRSHAVFTISKLSPRLLGFTR